jgi:three-Cys-motif partner protein
MLGANRNTGPRISMVEHLFGGPWTEIKLDAVQYYLECYAKALTPKKFDLWYIDAFAGTGDRIETRKVGGLLEGVPESTVTETLAGSARRALQVKPPFQHFIFNEMHAARRAALQKILTENPDRDIEILDAGPMRRSGRFLVVQVGLLRTKEKRAVLFFSIPTRCRLIGTP